MEQMKESMSDMGLSVKEIMRAFNTATDDVDEEAVPYWVSLAQDPLDAQALIYIIPLGVTKVKKYETSDTEKNCIKLMGNSLLTHHCTLTNDNNVVTITSANPNAVI